MNKNYYTFGRRQNKIQIRANLPIVLTVVGVIGIVYGVVNLVVAQIKPEETPVSTITVTKSTPSASELNLEAPLVDYNPNKDKDDEDDDEKKDDEKKEDKEEDDTEEVEVGTDAVVLGEQARSEALLKIIMPMFGAAAAKSSTSGATTNVEESERPEEKVEEKPETNEVVVTESGAEE